MVFSKVVEAGNYRLASESLNVTPSALSQTISSLEHSLGVPLFDRLGKKLVLTEIGEKIQKEFQLHHSALSRGLARIAGRSQHYSGLIRIGAYLEFAKFQLAPVLATFQKKYPDVQIKLVFDTPSRLHKLLEAHKLDFCFSIFPERNSQLIQSKPIYQEELVFIAPERMLDSKPTYLDVMATPMIEYYFNHQPIRRWLTLHYKKKPKDIPVRTFAATAEMVLALVQQGLGVGVIPEYLLRTNASKSVSICRPTEKKLVDHIWMLQLKGQHQTPILKAFTDSLNQKFNSKI